MAEHLLLEHFLRTADATDHGVVCFGPNTVISNRTAARLLRGADPISLCDRVAAEHEGPGTLHRHRIAGRDIVVECRALALAGEQAGRMLLLRMAEPGESVSPVAPTLPGLVGSSPIWEEISRQVFDLAATDGHVLVAGERGVGKLRAALAVVAVRGLKPVIFDAVGADALGTSVWLENVAASVQELADTSMLIVARVERLEPEVVESLVELIEGRSVPSLATAVRPERRGSARDLLDSVGLFAGRLHIPPLRHRPEDVEALASHFDARHGTGRLTWTTEALQVMEHYLWPGNLKELEQVVRDLLLRLPPTAEVDADVLPVDLFRSVRRGPLSRLEEAEVDVMLAALAEANGNKDLAAHLIGIHRATLYRKLQNYGLDWTPDS